MHVLVSGANGYLGSVLIPALLTAPHITRVTALVRQPSRFANVPFLAGCQLMDLASCLRGEADLRGIDIFCHLASCRDGTRPVEVASSLALTCELATLSLRHGVRGFVNASTHAVYGQVPLPWREETPVGPITSYGMAKYASELLVKNLFSGTPDRGAISLRLAKLVGPAPLFRVVPSELPHLLAHHALTGRPLALANEGQQQLDLLDVRDAATAIIELLTHPVDSWPALLNIGSDRTVTAAEVAARVSTLAETQYGCPLQYQLEPQTSRLLRNFGMSASAAGKWLNWKARRTLDQTIGDVLALLAHQRR